MDTDLVVQAQHGDKGAYGLVATEIADRFLAVSRRILRDIDLAEDATQQALLAIWQDLPQLRDPARFEAWSYRLLVRACYTEGRRSRQWSPNLRLLPDDIPAPFVYPKAPFIKRRGSKHGGVGPFSTCPPQGLWRSASR